MTNETNRAPAAPYDPNCLECKGTGERDSGGTHPWGEPAMLPCDCNRAAPVLASTGRAEFDEGKLMDLVRDFAAVCYGQKRTTEDVGGNLVEYVKSLIAPVAARELDADAERRASVLDDEHVADCWRLAAGDWRKFARDIERRAVHAARATAESALQEQP